MGLRTFLYALDEPVVSPCYRDDYTSDHRKQTIAETAYRIPLPWLAMFRVADLREEHVMFDEEDEPELQVAPVTTMEAAKGNIMDACKAVRRVFPQCARLPSYFELMVEELEQFQYPFVTIDATELYPEIVARRDLASPWEAVLAGFVDPDSVFEHVSATLLERLGILFGRSRPHPWLKAVNNFVEFDPEKPLPAPDYRRRGEAASQEEQGRHAALLPGGVHRTSVWDPEPTRERP